MTTAARIPRAQIGVLGVITIAAYGCWFYAFGVLFDPILADTGWSEPSLAVAFSVSSLLSGAGSIPGGWMLDRFGSRGVFGLAAIVTLAGFQVAAGTSDIIVFTVSSSIAGGTLGALAFYHVTQTTAVRISPRSKDRAIAVLTIWGAFASAIYMPIAALLVEPLGWRPTLRIVTTSAVIALAVGAITISTKTTDMPGSRHVFTELWESVKGNSTRRFLIAQGLAGIGVSTVLVYQVPAMTAAGLPLAAASFWAGARGFSQLLGRLPLMPIVNRFGVINSLRLSYVAIAVGMVVLAFAGNPVLAAVYAVLAGFGVGATSPLIGMNSAELFGEKSLGTAMGVLYMVFSMMGAVGPAISGFVADATGSRSLPVLLAAAVTALAAPMLSSNQPR